MVAVYYFRIDPIYWMMYSMEMGRLMSCGLRMTSSRLRSTYHTTGYRQTESLGPKSG